MDGPFGSNPGEPGIPFDARALQQHLQRHLDGFDAPLHAQRFEGGQSNPTYLLASGPTRCVMRSKPAPAARLLPSAHAIEREFAVMRALRDTGVPVPRMLYLCEDEAVIGRAFYLMEFVEGRVLWDPALPGMDPAARAAVYDEMNRVIATLHAVDAQRAGLAGFGRPGNYFERQIARWTKQYLASITEPIGAMQRLIEWLPRHIPPGARDDAQTCIVHGDYRLDNLVFHSAQPRVLAVLDWELSTLGHPLADLSYHCMAWRIPSGVFRGIGGLDLAALGIPDEARYIESYCRRTGRADIDAVMRDWNFYLAYNLFRMAAILQGIARRVLDGTAASAQAREAAAAARPLAELGWRTAQLPP
jgi:aminoglycoside phosphotransferase (APT) family kinase protein